MVFYALALPAGLSVAAHVFVALVLSWVCIELYRGTRNPGTQKGDALMLDLGLGLTAVAAAVLWFSISLQILSYSGSRNSRGIIFRFEPLVQRADKLKYRDVARGTRAAR